MSSKDFPVHVLTIASDVEEILRANTHGQHLKGADVHRLVTQRHPELADHSEELADIIISLGEFQQSIAGMVAQHTSIEMTMRDIVACRANTAKQDRAA